ncbi:MAG: hypothetical protein CFE43_21430 [Burkholderiales bacterium PBB3]|nr:MAG: hypothetical protein CFE43_21430 [Burkholderiales bacterium PBB3]
MTKKLPFTQLLAASGALVLALLAPAQALASSPAESVKCTNAPKTTWVGERRIRAHFDESQYVQVFFKVSKHKCYEFYAIGKDGSTVEAYYDPVSMKLVRYSRIDGGGKFQGTVAPDDKAELKNPQSPLVGSKSD